MFEHERGYMPRSFLQMKKITFPLILFSALGVARAYGENSLSIAPSLNHFDYTEYNSYNQRLDRELGWLPGLVLNANHSSVNGYQFLYEISYYSGTIDYSGYTNHGTSHLTQTDETLLTHRIRLSTQLKQNIALFASASRHAWNRNILTTNGAIGPVIGPYEKYRWKEYSAGISLKLDKNENSTWYLELSALRTSQAEFFADYSESNQGTVNLDLGERPGARAQLEWHYKYSSPWSLNIKARYEYWTFGKSNVGRTTGGATSIPLYEPRSETSNLSIQTAFEYRL